MVKFDKVIFDSNVNQLVLEQFATGKHRGPSDTAPSDWVVRAWQALPAQAASWVASAVHNALLDTSPVVRAEALRTLDLAPKMMDVSFLLDVVQNHFDLFRGLKRSGDSANTDRGRDLVQLVAGGATGQHGRLFRRQMAIDPNYGIYVLAMLTREDADWVIQNSSQLVNQKIDSGGKRLEIILFNLRKNETQLKQFVKVLIENNLVDNSHLTRAIQTKIRDTSLQHKLLSEIVNHNTK